jgi:hypothetical protein
VCLSLGMSGRGGGLRLYGGVSTLPYGARREADLGAARLELGQAKPGRGWVDDGDAAGRLQAVLDACRGCRYQSVCVDVD